MRQVWWQYVGLDGTVVGVKRYGLSGPATEVLKTVGVTVDAVVDAGKALLNPPVVTPMTATPMDGLEGESGFAKAESSDDIKMDILV